MQLQWLHNTVWTSKTLSYVPTIPVQSHSEQLFSPQNCPLPPPREMVWTVLFDLGKKKQPTNRPTKQTNNQKKRIPGTIHCKIFCNFGTASNGFWVTRSHCRDCLFDVTHKEASILSETLHSVMMRGEKTMKSLNDSAAFWTTSQMSLWELLSWVVVTKYCC